MYNTLIRHYTPTCKVVFIIDNRWLKNEAGAISPTICYWISLRLTDQASGVAGLFDGFSNLLRDFIPASRIKLPPKSGGGRNKHTYHFCNVRGKINRLRCHDRHCRTGRQNGRSEE